MYGGAQLAFFLLYSPRCLIQGNVLPKGKMGDSIASQSFRDIIRVNFNLYRPLWVCLGLVFGVLYL